MRRSLLVPYGLTSVTAGSYTLAASPPTGYASTSIQITVPLAGNQLPTLTLVLIQVPTTTTTTLVTATTAATLPVTGSQTGDITGIGILVLFTGLGLVALSRRRPEGEDG